MRQSRSVKFLILLLALFFSSAAISADSESAVMEETNFQQLAAEMQQKNMGLVMMLHAENCHYCEIMDQEILSPMVRSGEYKKSVFIRKLQIDGSDLITGFNGQRVFASEIADNYDSKLTPTLVFLDHTGAEQAVKILGINSIDLFSASVDEQIHELLSVIKKTQ